MSDERYAPPKAGVRDVGHERALSRRPRLVAAAALMIFLSWLADLPIAWAMYVQDPGSRDFLLIAEGVALAIVLPICVLLLRGHGWMRHVYLVITAGLLLLTFTSEQQPLPLYATVSEYLSLMLQGVPIGLLYVGPAARWYRELRA